MGGDESKVRAFDGKLQISFFVKEILRLNKPARAEVMQKKVGLSIKM